MAREPRFPGIDWYCDHCGALLNSQKNFDDHKYLWKCTNCGYKNSLSWDNISSGDSKVTKILLYTIGFMSYIGFWTMIMLAISIFIFHADKSRYLLPFFFSLGVYVFAGILSILVEFSIRHTSFSRKNLRIIVLRNLKEDIISPFMYLKEIASNLLSFITHIVPVKRKYVWRSNMFIISFAIIYVFIIAMEFVAFSRITGIGFSDIIESIRGMISRI